MVAVGVALTIVVTVLVGKKGDIVGGRARFE